MAKITGPLFGLRASATIGKTVTYATWRGVQYARTHVIPKNPKTAAQTAVRDVFETLNSMWLRTSGLVQAGWAAAALGRPFTDRNLFISRNVPLLQGDANLNDLLMQVGTGAVPPDAVAHVGGVSTITTTITPPVIPAGWTIQAGINTAVLQGDPSPPIIRNIFATEDLTSPYVPVIGGLPAGTYRASAFLRWTDPSGVTRYSPSFASADVIVT